MNLLAPLYRFADRIRYARHRNLGRRGEDRAHRYLRKQGFTVVARNWRPPQGGGELDLVAWDREKLVFVEVKSRAAGSASAPERDIDSEKMIALRRAASDYMRRANFDASGSRFDVIAIAGNRLEHLRDAFATAPSL